MASYPRGRSRWCKPNKDPGIVSYFSVLLFLDIVMFHGLSMGKIMSHYVLVQRQMSWYKARDFCQRHYIDLAVLSTEEQYFSLINATAANTVSFWVGLHHQNISSAWTWMDGEELTYQKWYRRNYQGCVSLEAMLEKDKKLLARYCDEWHMFVCQGE
uniref:C-type lectin domain-containing protein n=1 Tax=Labrus bergylta TaxID=56723 RepID=A0A3Q3FL74_9LABR